MEDWTGEIDKVLNKALEGVNAEESMDLLKKLYPLISYPESKELVKYQFNVYLKKKEEKIKGLTFSLDLEKFEQELRSGISLQVRSFKEFQQSDLLFEAAKESSLLLGKTKNPNIDTKGVYLKYKENLIHKKTNPEFQ
jgi:hypothetical protein